MTVVVIAGCMRNGTSICSNVLANAAGMWVGEHSHLDWRGERDPEGIWENLGFVNMNNRLIQVEGGHWVHPQRVWKALYYDWEAIAQNDPHVENLTEPALSLLREMRDGKDLWGWKDPRNALTVRFWINLLVSLSEKSIKLIWAYRNPSESILSMQSLRYSGFHMWDDFWNVWHAYNQSLMNYIKSPDFLELQDRGVIEFTTVHYEDWFSLPESTVERVMRFVDVNPTAKQIQAGCERIKPELYRYKRGNPVLSTLYEDIMNLDW